MALYQRAMEIAPDFFYEEAWVDDAFRAKGRFDDALAAEQAGERILGRPPTGMVLTLVAMGRRSEALQAMRRIEARISAGEYVAPEMVARAWLALGDADRAMDHLEQGLASLSLAVSYVPLLPEFRQLKQNERYRRYLEKADLARFFDNLPASPPAAPRSGGP